MSIVPSDKAVKLYVGSWGAWLESVGVSWEDKEEMEKEAWDAFERDRHEGDDEEASP